MLPDLFEVYKRVFEPFANSRHALYEGLVMLCIIDPR